MKTVVVCLFFNERRSCVCRDTNERRTTLEREIDFFLLFFSVFFSMFLLFFKRVLVSRLSSSSSPHLLVKKDFGGVVSYFFTSYKSS